VQRLNHPCRNTVGLSRIIVTECFEVDSAAAVNAQQTIQEIMGKNRNKENEKNLYKF
jgi:hypothetical protein